MKIPPITAPRAALALAFALPLAAAAVLARDPAPADPAPHTVLVRVTDADGEEVLRRGVVWVPSGSGEAARTRSFASFGEAARVATPSCETAPEQRAPGAVLRLTQRSPKADLRV
ncbi:MAG TPA: hypothetical protein VHG91_11625 [Longimicrobium sp.]|nr:hypothetical protein [Longimicrobium sp.]